MAMTTTEKLVKGLGVPDGAPEILVDGFDRVSIVNDVARLNFFAVRAGAKGGSGPVLVCRLALSLSALVGMRQQINHLVDDLLKQGLVKGAEDDGS